MDSDSENGARAESIWRSWLVGIFRIRDAIFALPAIPTAVWIFGVGLLALLRGVGVLHIRRLHRRATPVPDSVRALVADVSGQMGLRRVPRTLFMNEKTSPHVYCWRNPHLLLPRGLWKQLDDAGRRAVICHELAHLRRRDHWVCWIDAIVGGLYWWHPLVWWIRRRLRVEAENCCDAWVTWLLPRGRRSYAEALLLTKEFVGVQHGPQPRMGMAVGLGRAGTFRRRLTMVMTQTTKPRLSASGPS